MTEDLTAPAKGEERIYHGNIHGSYRVRAVQTYVQWQYVELPPGYREGDVFEASLDYWNNPERFVPAPARFEMGKTYRYAPLTSYPDNGVRYEILRVLPDGMAVALTTNEDGVQYGGTLYNRDSYEEVS